MKKKLILLTAFVLLCTCFLGCGKQQASVPETTVPVTTAAPTVPVTEAPTEPETEPTTEPTEPPETWRENILMENPCWIADGQFDNYVFFSDIPRKSIDTLNFLDTLADAPEDAWDVSEAQNGSVMAWVVPSTKTEGQLDLYIAGEGGVRAPASCDSLFCSYEEMTEVHFNDNFHVTSDVTTLHGIFSGDAKLEAIDVSTWDTSNVQYMTFMFSHCVNLTELDLSSWDTSSATDFTKAFRYCGNLQTLNLTNWDTSSCMCLEWMFSECRALERLVVSHFDTSNVLYMSQIFSNCKSLTSLDLSTWDTSKVIDFSDFFANCKALTDLNLGQWETDSAIYYSNFLPWGYEINGEPWQKLFDPSFAAG